MRLASAREVLVWVDASLPCHPPSPPVVSWVIRVDGRPFERRASLSAEAAGKWTSSRAEACAVVAALRRLVELELHRHLVTLYTDSQGTAAVLNGESKARRACAAALEQARELMSRFRSLRVEWIERDKNHVADTAARDFASARRRVQLRADTARKAGIVLDRLATLEDVWP